MQNKENNQTNAKTKEKKKLSKGTKILISLSVTIPLVICGIGLIGYGNETVNRTEPELVAVNVPFELYGDEPYRYGGAKVTYDSKEIWIPAPNVHIVNYGYENTYTSELYSSIYKARWTTHTELKYDFYIYL